MGRRRKNELAIWMNGHLVGIWKIRSGDHLFSYDETWLDSSHRRPISLSMPLRTASAPYKGSVVVNFFENLLPDSSAVKATLQAKLQTKSSQPLQLLEHLGGDCLGALQILPPGTDGARPDELKGTELTISEIAEILRNLPSFPMGVGGDQVIRLSLAGNHEKTAFLGHQGKWLNPEGPTPTTHIFKLPIGVTPERLDLSLSVENEWLCHLILKKFGLSVAEAEIRKFEDQKCLIVKRFDRLKTDSEQGILRLPHEDLCQATGTPSALKYQSDGGPGVKQCLELLSGSQDPLSDREAFFKAQILFWALCAIDGHAKNFSLAILPLGRFRLAPLYDVLSAYPILGHGTGLIPRQKAKLAMAVWGKNLHYSWDRIVKRHWLKTASDCGVPNAENLIHSITSQADSVINSVEAQLPKDFPKVVSEPILSGLADACRRLGL